MEEVTVELATFLRLRSTTRATSLLFCESSAERRRFKLEEQLGLGFGVLRSTGSICTVDTGCGR